MKKIIAYKSITKSQIAFYLETGKAPKDCAVNITEDAICLEPIDLDNINLMCEYPRKDYVLIRDSK